MLPTSVRDGAYLHHPCHPDHRFRPFDCPPANEVCAICKANSTNSEVTWFHCVEAGCHHPMCNKCFEIDEHVYASYVTVIRNPLSSHDDPTARVRTRPRTSSYALAPLYAAKLLEIVSHADSIEDPSQRFYRVTSGGWIDARTVVNVMPSDECMEGLTRYHLAKFRPEHGMPSMTLRDLVEITKQSIHLMETNAPYGIVMASLTLYPLLEAVATDRGGEALTQDEKALANATVGFTHYVMHMALEELECCMDDELPITDGTMLPLYEMILVRCVRAAADIQENWGVRLPYDFAGLLLRVITVFARIQLLLAEDAGGTETIPVRESAVVHTHIDLKLERQRLHATARVYTTVATRLLMALPGMDGGAALDIKALQPLREVLTYCDSEEAEAAFCQLAALCVRANSANQRALLYVDPLEIVARICRVGTHAESQLGAFQLIADAARHSPRNIGVVTTVLMDHLLRMANAPRSIWVIVAAFDCFYELAYNDPRGPGGAAVADSAATTAAAGVTADGLNRTPVRSGASGLQGSPRPRDRASTCTRLLYPGSALFQLGHTFSLDNGSLVNLCAACAARHQPSNAVSGGETAAYMHFGCQCVCCHGGGVTAHGGGAPVVPATSALLRMSASNLCGLMVSAIRSYHTSVDILNAIGRLALRLIVTADVIATLFDALAEAPNLTPFSQAALAVASYAHLPCVAERLLVNPGAPLSQYLLAPYAGTKAAPGGAGSGIDSAATSARRGLLGLTNTTERPSAYRSSEHESLRVNDSVTVVDWDPATSLFADGARDPDSVGREHI